MFASRDSSARLPGYARMPPRPSHARNATRVLPRRAVLAPPPVTLRQPAATAAAPAPPPSCYRPPACLAGGAAPLRPSDGRCDCPDPYSLPWMALHAGRRAPAAREALAQIRAPPPWGPVAPRRRGAARAGTARGRPAGAGPWGQHCALRPWRMAPAGAVRAMACSVVGSERAHVGSVEGSKSLLKRTAKASWR